MKALLIFIDMLNGNRLKLCNPETTEKAIENTLKKLGGTVYTNCFTPCPDTPRSTATVWTGVMPRKNFCNTRVKYPRFYLNSEIDNIWKLCLRNEMEINLFLPPIYVEEGILPAGIEKNAHLTPDMDLKKYLKIVNPQENSMTGFFLQDFHRVLDDTGYISSKNYKAYELIDRELNMIFNVLSPKDFDVIILYSDHGFSDFEDGKKVKIGPDLICKDRIQIYLQIYKRGDMGIRTDDRLSCTTDIFPTFAGLCGSALENEVDGLDLFGEKVHDRIVVEDHAKFTSNIGQLLEYWGIIDSFGITVTDFYGNWWPNIDDKKRIREYEQLLMNEGCEYTESVKFINVMRRYKDAQDVDVYDTMQKRIKEKPSVFRKIWRRLTYAK